MFEKTRFFSYKEKNYYLPRLLTNGGGAEQILI